MRHVAIFGTQMNHDSSDVKQKRERFKQLTQTAKVQTGKAYAADVRRSKIHPTVKKLTAWRKLNRLSQRKAVAVLGKTLFPCYFRQPPKLGRRAAVPQPTYCRDP